jgi:hypothetical protein
MIVYISKTKERLNRKSSNIEFFSDYVCINPKYPNITIKNKNIKILMDSGAFQDTSDNKRISPEQSITRQLKLETVVGMTSQKIVAYDYIGNVEQTSENNRYLISKRMQLYPRQLVLMVQGETISEYLDCLQRTLEISSSFDCIGFGGVALAGRHKDIKNKLITTLNLCLPMLLEKQITNVHIFGVGTISILKEISDIFKKSLFSISCDTATVEIGSVMGRVLGIDGKWKKSYDRKDKYINYHPCDLMHFNIKNYIQIVREI